MQSNFSPSTNILRDVNRNINYIATPNTKEIFNQILNNLKSGVKTFNLIGSYGTGKSTFLWAIQQNLVNEKNYFINLNGQFGGIKQFEFINIIGDYKSLSHSLLESIKSRKITDPYNQAIEKLDTYYNKKCTQNKYLFIFIDEFGKFLEYAAKNNPEKELYFIQQLAEYVNNEENNIVLISTLHQGFSSYSKGLDREQKNEWEKVKGRIKEISFNEPVEQLIKLSADFISTNFDFTPNIEKVSQLSKLINKSKLTGSKDSINMSVLEKIYPLDLLSASILVQSLQRYGQNERSLFSFLSSSDVYGLNKIKNTVYSVESVYDYLNHNFFSFINSKFNPDFSQWNSIKSTLERVKGRFDDEQVNYRVALVKTIGLINLFGSNIGVCDKKTLAAYHNFTLEIDNSELLIEDLEKKNFIRFAKYKNQYKIFDGTDLNVDEALIDAENRIDTNYNILDIINKYVEMPILMAKKHMLEKGTSRFFPIQVSSKIITDIDPNYDGIINIVLEDKIKAKDLPSDEAIVYCELKEISSLNSSIHEIKKLEYIIEQNINDLVALSELNNLLNLEVSQIKSILLSSIFNDNADWYFNNKRIEISSLSKLNKFLSKVSDKIYHATPIFHNELINKTKLSGAVSAARKEYFKNLINYHDCKDIAYEKDKFPPQKTIYLTLLKNTGLHYKVDAMYGFKNPNSDFKDLWNISEEYIKSASVQPRRITEFIDLLSLKPLGLKKAFIDHWVGTFLFIKREEFALYYQDRYEPNINFDNIELINKSPKDFIIKYYHLTGKRLELFNRYRDLIDKDSIKKASNSSFIQTIRPFLMLERQLPQTTKKTSRLSENTISLRDAISKTSDPEKAFFEEFPAAFSIYNIAELSDENISEYIISLKEAIDELNLYYSSLIDNTYSHITKILSETDDFIELKNNINSRYKSIKSDLLPKHIKSFFIRLTSGLDDKESWINSMVQDLVGCTLQEISDIDYDKLKNRFETSFLELDHLVDLHKVKLKKEQEIFRIEFTSSKGGDQAQQFILDKSSQEDADELAKNLLGKLSDDINTNKLALIKLLKKISSK